MPNIMSKAISLQGQHVRLEPLSLQHCNDLMQATNDGELSNLWYTNVPAADTMQTEIQARLKLQQQGLMSPFAVIEQATAKAVGMTSYANLEPTHNRLEIGYTWYAKRIQRTAINTEAKLLLLQHAFEVFNCIAVELRTHYLNQQSRRAIERLGAKLDGILRNHRRMADGSLRDTCVYSIIQAEWPAIKTHLQWQLKKPHG